SFAPATLYRLLTYSTTSTRMTMNRKITNTPPPTKSKMSGTVDRSLRDRFHDEAVAGDPDHARIRADRDIGGRGRAELVPLPLLLGQDAAVATGRDADRHEDGVTHQVVERERGVRLRPTHHREQAV